MSNHTVKTNDTRRAEAWRDSGLGSPYTASSAGQNLNQKCLKIPYASKEIRRAARQMIKKDGQEYSLVAGVALKPGNTIYGDDVPETSGTKK